MPADMFHIVGALMGAGWDETRLGKCHQGDKVLLMPENAAPTILDIIETDTEDSSVVTSDGASYSPQEYALRAPRFEYPTGTVALIRSYGEPVRAWRDRDVWHTENGEIVFGDRVIVTRVLLPVDADAPGDDEE